MFPCADGAACFAYLDLFPSCPQLRSAIIAAEVLKATHRREGHALRDLAIKLLLPQPEERLLLEFPEMEIVKEEPAQAQAQAELEAAPLAGRSRLRGAVGAAQRGAGRPPRGPAAPQSGHTPPTLAPGPATPTSPPSGADSGSGFLTVTVQSPPAQGQEEAPPEEARLSALLGGGFVVKMLTKPEGVLAGTLPPTPDCPPTATDTRKQASAAAGPGGVRNPFAQGARGPPAPPAIDSDLGGPAGPSPRGAHPGAANKAGPPSREGSSEKLHRVGKDEERTAAEGAEGAAAGTSSAAAGAAVSQMLAAVADAREQGSRLPPVKVSRRGEATIPQEDGAPPKRSQRGALASSSGPALPPRGRSGSPKSRQLADAVAHAQLASHAVGVVATVATAGVHWHHHHNHRPDKRSASPSPRPRGAPAVIANPRRSECGLSRLQLSRRERMLERQMLLAARHVCLHKDTSLELFASKTWSKYIVSVICATFFMWTSAPPELYVALHSWRSRLTVWHRQLLMSSVTCPCPPAGVSTAILQLFCCLRIDANSPSSPFHGRWLAQDMSQRCVWEQESAQDLGLSRV